MHFQLSKISEQNTQSEMTHSVEPNLKHEQELLLPSSSSVVTKIEPDVLKKSGGYGQDIVFSEETS